jgi:hypothetical protein
MESMERETKTKMRGIKDNSLHPKMFEIRFNFTSNVDHRFNASGNASVQSSEFSKKSWCLAFVASRISFSGKPLISDSARPEFVF